MKNHLAIPILLIVIGLVMYINYTRIKKLKTQLSVEAAKNSFIIQHCNNATALYDSVYAKDGTVSFYKDGSLLGKSVTVIE